MVAMALMIDTLKFAEAFERGGFAPQQARTLATALADAQAVSIEDLATKHDLSLLRKDLEVAVAGLKQLIEAKDARADRRLLIIVAAVTILGPIATHAIDVLSRTLG